MGIKIKEFNKGKALEYLAEKLNEDIENIQMNGIFYDNLHEAFKWVFEEEVDGESDLWDLVNKLKEVSALDMKKIGADTACEYLVLSHDHMHITPYGYVYYTD